MTLRRIDSYATDNPEKLQDQLSRLEDNIDAALSLTTERLKFGDWISSDVAPVQLAYGHIARLDTSVAPLSASLPSVTPETAGRQVGVKVKGANNATIWPVEETALIDGSSSAALVGTALYIYAHDGQEWSQV